MKGIFQHIIHSDLAKNSAKLLSANVVAQAIALLVYPVLSRLYSAEDFGLLNLFLSIGGVLTILSTGEYQYAIVLPRDERKAHAVMQVGLYILLAVVVLVGASVMLADPIAQLLDAPRLREVYGWMPLYVLASGLWVLFNYRYTRARKFGVISGYQVSQSVVGSVLKIVLGWLHRAGGLVAGSVLAPVVSLLCYGRQMTWQRVSRSELREAAAEYGKFPMYSLPRAVVNNLSGNLPAFVLTPFFGLGELGYFAMAMTLAFRPLNMVSSSLYQTFFQRTAEAVNARRSIMPFFRKFILLALSVVVVVFVGLYFVLPWLTGWLLGAGWEQAGELIRVMLPWLAMSVVVAPICFLSDVFGKQNVGLAFEVAFLLARLAGLAVGVYLDSFYYAIVGYAIGGAVVIAVQLVWLMSLVRDYERQL